MTGSRRAADELSWRADQARQSNILSESRPMSARSSPIPLPRENCSRGSKA